MPIYVQVKPIAPAPPAPTQRPSVGLFLLARDEATRAEDLIRQMNQQHFGGRPSGWSEIWNIWQERQKRLARENAQGGAVQTTVVPVWNSDP